MEAPYTIAPLPRPLDTKHGKVQAAAVYGIRGSSRRKRHEVAVGIDGEGVNIYNVSSQTLATSYALPPQSYLSCPPCSVYLRRPKPAASQRRTYLVLKDSPQDKKRRLLCLTEDIRVTGRDIDEAPAPTKKEFRLEEGDILGVDLLSSVPDGEPQILVSYRNGRIECISSDLSRCEWRHIDQRTSKRAHHLEHFGLTDCESARKGLLAGREDILAVLEAQVIDPQLLYCLVRIGEQRSLWLYAIRSQQLQSQHKHALQHLATCILTGSSSDTADNPFYETHPATGKVYQLLDGRLSIYDLSGTVPRLAISLGSKAEPILSFARLSASSVLVKQADKAAVYETKYGSVQGSAFLQTEQNTGRSSNKRKRFDDVAWRQNWKILSNFGHLGVTVALAGTELMGVQLAEELRSTKRTKSESTLLVSVLSKGMQATLPLDKKVLRKWKTWTSSVDSAVARNDSKEIEKTVEQALELRLEMLYLLSKLFRPVPENEFQVTGSAPIATTVQSSTVYEWLALTGFLTAQTLLRAFKLWCDDEMAVTLEPGDIMHALKDFDGTFQLVHDLLEDNIFWDLPELVQALRLLIGSLETPADGSPQQLRALTAPPAQPNGEVAMVNGDAESHAESQAIAAERELDLALNALLNGPQLRSETLRLILSRLETFSGPSVTKTMRQMLRQEDLIFFIKIMRIELLEGGWHQRYIVVQRDNEYQQRGDDDVAPSDRALTLVGWLIGCAVDAIGIGGFLVGQSAEVAGMYQFITELRAEVSAALEGLYENNNLQVQLEELERFASDAAKAGKMQVTGGKDDLLLDAEERMLPMGCKADLSDLGGEKGVHAWAQAQRAKIGAYVFERIRF